MYNGAIKIKFTFYDTSYKYVFLDFFSPLHVYLHLNKLFQFWWDFLMYFLERKNHNSYFHCVNTPPPSVSVNLSWRVKGGGGRGVVCGEGRSGACAGQPITTTPVCYNISPQPCVLYLPAQKQLKVRVVSEFFKDSWFLVLFWLLFDRYLILWFPSAPSDTKQCYRETMKSEPFSVMIVMCSCKIKFLVFCSSRDTLVDVKQPTFFLQMLRGVIIRGKW